MKGNHKQNLMNQQSLIYLFVLTAMNESVVVADADSNVYAKECYERKWMGV